eukprot:871284-Rhodomonas_salina.1
MFGVEGCWTWNTRLGGWGKCEKSTALLLFVVSRYGSLLIAPHAPRTHRALSVPSTNVNPTRTKSVPKTLVDCGTVPLHWYDLDATVPQSTSVRCSGNRGTKTQDDCKALLKRHRLSAYVY